MHLATQDTERHLSEPAQQTVSSLMRFYENAPNPLGIHGPWPSFASEGNQIE
jgi:hypothetical protein